MNLLSNFSDELLDFINLFPYHQKSYDVDTGKKSFKINVAGYGKEDLKAKITNDGVLVLNGDNGEDTFERRYRIPGVGSSTKLNLKCEKGILTIKLPEKENKQLEIQGG